MLNQISNNSSLDKVQLKDEGLIVRGNQRNNSSLDKVQPAYYSAIDEALNENVTIPH